MPRVPGGLGLSITQAVHQDDLRALKHAVVNRRPQGADAIPPLEPGDDPGVRREWLVGETGQPTLDLLLIQVGGLGDAINHVWRHDHLVRHRLPPFTRLA
jgi:hypothetical protein